MIVVRIDTDYFNSEMNRLEKRLTDLRGGMRTVGDLCVRQQKLHFDAGRDRHYRTWPPLRPWSSAVQPQGGSKPLAGKGILKNAIKAAPPGKNHVTVFVPTSTAKEPRLEKIAKPHQFGALIRPRSKKVLARKLTKAEAQRLAAAGVRVSRSKKTGEFYLVFGRMVRMPRREFLYVTRQEGAALARRLALWVTEQSAALGAAGA